MWGTCGGWICWSTSTASRDDVERVKPDPELFLTVLADLDAQPREAVVFGISPNGIRAAKAAGLLCVAVPNPVTRQYSLAQQVYASNRWLRCRCSP